MPVKTARKPSPGAQPERVALLSIALLASEDGKVPTEFCIFRPGPNESSKGIYKFSEASAGAVLKAAAKYANDFAIDYGHQMHSFLQLDPAEGLKAAGWFTPAVRDGALWATKVRWTPKAEQKLADKEFRYQSAVFRHSEDGEIQELLSVGLTNTPAMYGQEPLMLSALAQSNPSQPPPEPRAMELSQLIAMLSMNANATEADVMAELARRQAAIAELTAFTGQKDLPGVLGTVKAWKANSDSVAALTQRITELENKQKDEALTAMLTKATTEGRITPAQQPMLRKMPVEQLEAFLSACQPIKAIKDPAQEVPKDGSTGANGVRTVSLSETDQFVAEKMGVDVKALAQAKAATGGKVLIAEVTPEK